MTDKEMAKMVIDRMPDDATLNDITNRFMNINSAADLATYMAKEGIMPAEELTKWVTNYITKTSKSKPK